MNYVCAKCGHAPSGHIPWSSGGQSGQCCYGDVAYNIVCDCAVDFRSLDAAVIEAAVAWFDVEAAYEASTVEADWSPMLVKCVGTREALVSAIVAWKAARKEAHEGPRDGS
jgi:hypothetical protein